MMDNSIQIPLDLPDVRVLEVSKMEEGDWLIRVESTLKSTKCRKCGRKLTQFHGFDQTIRLRHLPVFEQPVYVEFRLLAISMFSLSRQANHNTKT